MFSDFRQIEVCIHIKIFQIISFKFPLTTGIKNQKQIPRQAICFNLIPCWCENRKFCRRLALQKIIVVLVLICHKPKVTWTQHILNILPSFRQYHYWPGILWIEYWRKYLRTYELLAKLIDKRILDKTSLEENVSVDAQSEKAENELGL